MSKYTPEPWEYHPTWTYSSNLKALGYEVEVMARDAEGGPIAIAATTHEHAPLIAAAPELLEALTSILNEIHIDPLQFVDAVSCHKILTIVRAAIAKTKEG